MKKEYDFKGGRRGAVIRKPAKERITMYVDTDVLAAFRQRARASGVGYQTLINQALRDHLSKSSKPVDARTLRRILREELNDV